MSEELWGWHAKKGLEASTARHKGFQRARRFFYEYWATWFDFTGETALFSHELVKAMGRGPQPPFGSVEEWVKWVLREYKVEAYTDNSRPTLSFQKGGRRWVNILVIGSLPVWTGQDMYEGDPFVLALKFGGVRERLFEIKVRK